MKINILIINIFLAVGFSSYCQTVFNRVYNDYSYVYERTVDTTFYYNDESFWSLINTFDGNILAIGTASTNSLLFGDSVLRYVYLVKTTQNGDTIWSKRNNISNYYNYIRDSYQYSDSSFVLFGSTVYDTSDQIFASIIFIDKNGDYLRHLTIDLGGDTEFTKVKTQDGGITFDIIGRINIDPNGSGNLNTFAVKIDSSGSIQQQFWGSDYGQLEFFYDLEYTTDSSIFIAGSTPRQNGGSGDYHLLKLDKNYNLLWEYIYNNGGAEIIGTEESLIVEADGLVFCGWSLSNNYDIKARVSKLDFNGNFIWEYASEEKSIFNGYKVIRKTADGHYVAAGGTGDPNFTNHRSRALLSKVSNTGELIWTRIISKYWDNGSYDYLFDLEIAPDGGFLLAGYQISSGVQTNGIYHRNDAWLAKTDSCGFTVGAEPQALLTVDSVVNNTVYITNLSEHYCTATLYLGNGDSLNIYAYSQFTNGKDPNQLQYTYPNTGTYTLTLHAYAGDGTAIFTTQDIETALFSRADKLTAVKAFPNPAKDYFILEADFSNIRESSAKEKVFGGIYNLTGQLVQSFSINPNVLQQRIYLNDLSNGVYFLKISYGKTVVGNEKLVIVKA